MLIGTNTLPITLPDVEVRLPPSSAALAAPMDTNLSGVQTANEDAIQREVMANGSPDTGTEALPEAIRANWFAISDVSVKTYDEIFKIARLEAGWSRPYSRPLNARSLHHFLRFREKVQNLAVDPEFVMTTKGYLQAEWHKSRRRHLEVEFCDDGKVFYGLFDGASIHEGVGQVAEIVAFLRGRQNNPLSWC